jgi:hypothetical protein
MLPRSGSEGFLDKNMHYGKWLIDTGLKYEETISTI